MKIQTPELHHIKLLLTPSSLSSIVTVTLMTLATVVVAVGTHYKNSLLSETLAVASHSSGSAYQQLASRLDKNGALANVPLFLFWGCVGLIVYFFATALYRALSDAAELKAEMGYVNTRRSQIVEVFVHLAVRLAALAGWLVYTRYFLHTIVPYVLSQLRLVAVDGTALTAGLAYLLAGFLLGLLALHAHAIFARLVLLRPRIFSVNYDD